MRNAMTLALTAVAIAPTAGGEVEAPGLARASARV